MNEIGEFLFFGGILGYIFAYILGYFKKHNDAIGIDESSKILETEKGGFIEPVKRTEIYKPYIPENDNLRLMEGLEENQFEDEFQGEEPEIES
jgi:hypothetical protein